MAETLKLYVWDDVLRSYYPGIAFALAASLEDAREAIHQKCLQDGTTGTWDALKDELHDNPLVCESSAGFFVYGGE